MTKRAKKMYEENCVYDYNEEICREFAENDDLREQLYREEGEHE